MTCLQAMRACIENACRADWSLVAEGSPRRHPLVPATAQPLLLDADMGAVAGALLRCLAESFQRRAVLRAEAQTDEDYDEEQGDEDKRKGSEEEELQVPPACTSLCLAALRFIPSVVCAVQHR